MKPVVLDRSPVEFVLVGPISSSREGIWFRSTDAQLDLIGFAAGGKHSRDPDSRDYLSTMVDFDHRGREFRRARLSSGRTFHSVSAQLPEGLLREDPDRSVQI